MNFVPMKSKGPAVSFFYECKRKLTDLKEDLNRRHVSSEASKQIRLQNLVVRQIK